MEINPIGKHKLTVIEVNEKPSRVRENKILISVKMQVDDTDKVIYIYFSEDNPLMYWIINKLWKWYGQRIGKSILNFDLNKLIGRCSDFELVEENYLGKKFSTIKWK